MQKRDVQGYEFELSIGDVLHIGESQFTVIDIDGQEVSFRVDSGDNEEDQIVTGLQQVCVPR
jgi:hypothetical protein